MMSNVVRPALAWRRKSEVKNIRLNFNTLGEDTPIGWLKNCFTAHVPPCIISVRLGLNWNYKVLVAQSCITLCGPMDCRPLGYSVHRIFQARILKWVAISFSRGSSWSRDQTHVLCIVGRFFTIWATGEANEIVRSMSQAPPQPN